MKLGQAVKLKKGDKVKQKMHGYIFTVKETRSCHRAMGMRDCVMVICETENGEIMKHNHKELLLVTE